MDKCIPHFSSLLAMYFISLSTKNDKRKYENGTSFNQSSVENGWSLLHYITNLGHTWMVGHILEKTDESEAYLWI